MLAALPVLFTACGTSDAASDPDGGADTGVDGIGSDTGPDAAPDALLDEILAYEPRAPWAEDLAMACRETLTPDPDLVAAIEADIAAIAEYDDRIPFGQGDYAVYADRDYRFFAFEWDGDRVDAIESLSWPPLHARIVDGPPGRVRYYDTRDVTSVTWALTLPVRAELVADRYAHLGQTRGPENLEHGCVDPGVHVDRAETAEARWYRYRSSSDSWQLRFAYAVTDDAVYRVREDCWAYEGGGPGVWAEMCESHYGLGEAPWGEDEAPGPWPDAWCGAGCGF